MSRVRDSLLHLGPRFGNHILDLGVVSQVENHLLDLGLMSWGQCVGAGDLPWVKGQCLRVGEDVLDRRMASLVGDNVLDLGTGFGLGHGVLGQGMRSWVKGWGLGSRDGILDLRMISEDGGMGSWVEGPSKCVLGQCPGPWVMAGVKCQCVRPGDMPWVKDVISERGQYLTLGDTPGPRAGASNPLGDTHLRTTSHSWGHQQDLQSWGGGDGQTRTDRPHISPPAPSRSTSPAAATHLSRSPPCARVAFKSPPRKKKHK